MKLRYWILITTLVTVTMIAIIDKFNLDMPEAILLAVVTGILNGMGLLLISIHKDQQQHSDE